MIISLCRAKTNQEGAGLRKGIPCGSRANTCAARALLAWLDASGIQEGPIFRAVNRDGQLRPGRLSAQVDALVVKNAAGAAGCDPACFSGHSLGRGFITTATGEEVSEEAIARQSGHKSRAQLRKYIEAGSLFRRNAAAAVVGL